MVDLFAAFHTGSFIAPGPTLYKPVLGLSHNHIGSGEYSVTCGNGPGQPYSMHNANLRHLRVQIGADQYRDATAEDVAEWLGC